MALTVIVVVPTALFSETLLTLFALEAALLFFFFARLLDREELDREEPDREEAEEPPAEEPPDPVDPLDPARRVDIAFLRW